MKSVTLVIAFLFTRYTGDCQVSNDTLNSCAKFPSHIDSIVVEKQLPVYQVARCLADLLNAIVDGDEGASYAGGGAIFYSLNLEDHLKYVSMDIWPMRWNKTSYFDYYAAVNIKGIWFLCRGDFKDDTMFHKISGQSVTAKLQRAKKNKADETDNAINALFLNPALRGKYNACDGRTFYTEVYIEGKLPDFDVLSD